MDKNQGESQTYKFRRRVYMKNLIKRKKKKGFTLMELLVSLGIVAALSMMVAPMIMGKVDEAKEKADISNANAIAVAVKAEMLEGKVIPASASGDDLITLVGKYFDGGIPVPQSIENGNFVVTFNNNKVSVKVGDDVFYPAPVESDE